MEREGRGYAGGESGARTGQRSSGITSAKRDGSVRTRRSISSTPSAIMQV